MSDYLAKRMQLILDGRPLKTKERKPIAKVGAKRQAKLDAEKKANSVEGKEETLNEWFQKIQAEHWIIPIDEKLFAKCMECGKLISEDYARHATAHLLPKKLFKSIATNDLNYLILGAGCGCHDLTHRLDKFVKMKVWPQAAKQINQLLPLLPFEELRYISAQLYDALENY